MVREIEKQSVSYWYGEDRSASTPRVTQPVTALTAQEFQPIETFLARRLDIPNLQRLQTAQMIADRVGERLNVPKADR